MIRKLTVILCICMAILLMSGCNQTDGNNDVSGTPIICDTINATADKFQIIKEQAYGTSKPEVEDGKDATPFIITLTYTGSEGASYVLGDASEETDKYLRFRLLYADEYYFEEYYICGEDDDYLTAKAYKIQSGEIIKDLPFLHFEPMEKSSQLQLWMVVPAEVMNADESVYFIINVGEQEFWFDLTGDDLDFYKEW